jgi:hypothetical protein
MRQVNPPASKIGAPTRLKNHKKMIFKVISYIANAIEIVWTELIASIFSDSSKHLQRCDILFFCHDHNRDLFVGGRYYSQLIDSLAENFEKFGYKTQTIATPWSRHDGVLAFGSTFTINREYLYFLLYHRFIKIKEITLKKKSTESPLVEFYEKVLNKTGAKLIITIGASGFLSYAAKKKEVCHFEILHGYGYAVIPFGWDRLPVEYLPQGLLSLDALSTQTFNNYFNGKIEIWQIENPFYKSEILGFFKNKKTKNDSRDKCQDYRRKILILLQWGYEKNNSETPELQNIIENGVLLDEILDLIMGSHGRVYFRIRLHPVQLRSKGLEKNIKKYLNSRLMGFDNWDCNYSSEFPLSIVASDCVGGITMSSSAAYELAMMGTETLALCPTVQKNGFQANVFEDLERDGYVKKMLIADVINSNWIYSVEKKLPWKGGGESINTDELMSKLICLALGS